MFSGMDRATKSVGARHRRALLLRVIALAAPALFAGFCSSASTGAVNPDDNLESARHAYEISDYPKVIQLLQESAAKDPKNPEIFLLLTKSYNELQQHDQAIASAERSAPSSILRGNLYS